MPRFALHPHAWYAMEFVFRSAERHFSPIWLEEITPLKTGNGMLRLVFFHANYPEGVQDKAYDLQVVQRFERHLIALRRSDGVADATVILEPITREWCTQHFPQMRLRDKSDLSLASELDRATGRVPS